MSAARARRRLRCYVDGRDWWVGVYVAVGYVYVCLLPTLVIRWARKGWPP